jgi:hypothetical protein
MRTMHFSHFFQLIRSVAYVYGFMYLGWQGYWLTLAGLFAIAVIDYKFLMRD